MRLALLLTLLLSFVALAPFAEAQRAVQAWTGTRYEYSMLTFYHGSVTSATFSDSDGSESAESSYSLYRILGGESEREGFSVADLLNLLGGRGWALASTVSSGGFMTTHFLMRPRR